MKNIVMGLVGVIVAGSAIAGDLPSRKTAPLPPVRPAEFNVVEPQFYVGVNAGVAATDKTDTFVGASAGWQVNPFLRLEGTYDYNWKNNTAFNSNALTGNVIGQYRYGSFTPYVLAGAGYRWMKHSDEAIWNVGGGVRYAITKNVEADLRYRYVAGFDTRSHDNIVTLGLNYRF